MTTLLLAVADGGGGSGATGPRVPQATSKPAVATAAASTVNARAARPTFFEWINLNSLIL